MEAQQSTLIRMLSGEDKRFKIPVYQRAYSWKISNCEQLLNDLKSVYINNYDTHFFGSIVYLDEDHGDIREYTIIDGQQRVTTVCLLLLAIRNYINNNKLTTNIKVDKITEAYLIDKFSNDEKKLKLKLVDGDDATYEKVVQNLPLIENNGIATNYTYFYNYLDKLSIDEIEKLYDAILKLMIVCVSLKLRDGDNPQLIFESLNSTGEELEEADKIRNFVLMGLSSNEQDRIYKNYWEELEKRTGKNELNAFIRYYLAIKLNNLSNEKKLYVDFKKLKTDNLNIQDLLTEMLKFASYYKMIKTFKYDDVGYKGSIGRMMYLDISTVIPLLFNLFNAKDDGLLDDEDMDEAMQIIESYYVRRTICNLPAASINKTYVSIGFDIDNYMDKNSSTYLDALKHSIFIRTGKTRFPNDTEFKENFITFELYNAKSEFRKYILERLENTNSRERVAVQEQINKGQLTIEHIMPQTITTDWKKMLGDNWLEVSQKYMDTIGNLTLSAYNSDYSNFEFNKKKTIPEKGFMYSKLFLNEFIKEKDEWKEKDILERANLLANNALKIWRALGYTNDNDNDEFWVDLDDEFDYTNKTVKKVLFLGDEIPTKDISEVFTKLNVALYSRNPEVYVGVNDKYITDNEDLLRKPFKVGTNVYVETNMSSQNKIDFIKSIIKKFNIEMQDVRFLVGIKLSKDTVDEIIENDKMIKVGVLAYSLFKELLENNKISEEEIIKLFDKDYTRKTFSRVTYPAMAYSRNANMGNSKQYRYYKEPVVVNNKKYYITSQWFEDSRNDLLKWYNEHK